MGQRESTAPLDEFVVRVTRKYVRRLVGRGGFTATDREDLEQQILLEALRRLRQFDPARGKRESFVARIVETTASTLLLRRRAPCRDWRRCASLHDRVPDADGRSVEIWRTLEQDVGRAARGVSSADRADREDLRVDVAAAVATLPPELRRLCAALACGTVGGAARASGIPRRTARGRTDRIRAHFERCGLGEYVEHLAPLSPPARVRKKRGHGAASHGRTA